MAILAVLNKFQSPSNRVKCSDSAGKMRDWSEQYVFQSPSNRVKCSDAGGVPTHVLYHFEFQSPSNRVKCSDIEHFIEDAMQDIGFNPLVIGSSVLILFNHKK